MALLEAHVLPRLPPIAAAVDTNAGIAGTGSVDFSGADPQGARAPVYRDGTDEDDRFVVKQGGERGPVVAGVPQTTGGIGDHEFGRF